METQIQSYSFSSRAPAPITLFGYASKSLPGLEINGFGKYGKTLKEKIIFISRSRQLPIPLKRYVISAEYDLGTEAQVLRWLDLPVLMLYWYLAGHIRMGRLDNCFASGHITPSGEIFGRNDQTLQDMARQNRWLMLGSELSLESQPCIDPKDLMGHIPDLKFKMVS